MRKKRKDTIGFIKRIYKPRPGNAGHINQILGKSRTDPECWYQHVKTKQEFWSINGALGWPAQDGSCDGYAVIIGVTKSKPLNFHALAETIAPTPEELIDACVALRKDYGFGFPHKLIIWRGDPERFPDWSLKNAELTKKKTHD